jgi:hypothetical protein
MTSEQNIEIERKAIEYESKIETIVVNPKKKQNSFLNPNDDFGTLQKGVVIENQTYEYEVRDNDSCNFIILEAVDEPREIVE